MTEVAPSLTPMRWLPHCWVAEATGGHDFAEGPVNRLPQSCHRRAPETQEAAPIAGTASWCFRGR